MTQAIQFLLAALKDAPNSICNYQLATIEAFRKIFENCRTVESLTPASPKLVPPTKPIVPIQESSPIRYPASTSKGDHDRDRVKTFKGASQQHTLISSKNTQVAANYKGDQEPISTLTRSRIDSANLPTFKEIHPLSEPVAARTRSIKLYHNYTTPSQSRALATQLLTYLS